MVKIKLLSLQGPATRKMQNAMKATILRSRPRVSSCHDHFSLRHWLLNHREEEADGKAPSA